MSSALRHVRTNAVAYAALFVALGGTSYAAIRLPADSVGSRQVINHSLRAVDFRSGQLPRGAAGPQGPAGVAGPAGPQGPAGSVTSLWAIVRADGSIVYSSSHVTAVNRFNGGQYSVTFDRNVTQCADLVNIGGWTKGGEVLVPGGGEASAAVVDSGAPNQANTVNVYTRDSGGTLADRGFHLAVVC
jgi:hypothetical protein